MGLIWKLRAELGFFALHLLILLTSVISVRLIESNVKVPTVVKFAKRITMQKIVKNSATFSKSDIVKFSSVLVIMVSDTDLLQWNLVELYFILSINCTNLILRLRRFSWLTVISKGNILRTHLFWMGKTLEVKCCKNCKNGNNLNKMEWIRIKCQGRLHHGNCYIPTFIKPKTAE